MGRASCASPFSGGNKEMRTARTLAGDVVLERSSFFDTYFGDRERSFADVRDDLKVKRALRRAVMRDLAPQRLIDAIRSEIRS